MNTLDIHTRRLTDYVNKQIRDTIHSNLEQEEISPQHVAVLKATIERQLNQLQAQAVLQSYRDVVISSKADSLEIDVTFAPIVPIKHINTTFIVNKETKELSEEEKLVEYIQNKPW